MASRKERYEVGEVIEMPAGVLGPARLSLISSGFKHQSRMEVGTDDRALSTADLDGSSHGPFDCLHAARRRDCSGTGDSRELFGYQSFREQDVDRSIRGLGVSVPVSDSVWADPIFGKPRLDQLFRHIS